MSDDPVLGTIQIARSRGVEWVRVTESEGWACALIRVLGSPALAGTNVCLQAWEEGAFRDSLSFVVPDKQDG